MPVGIVDLSLHVPDLFRETLGTPVHVEFANRRSRLGLEGLGL